MFIGNYQHSVDKKFRVKLPSNLRQKIVDSSLILSKGNQKNIIVYTHESWNEFIQPIKKKALHNDKYRKFLRLKFSSASEVNVDSQGRIRLPKDLKEYCGIEDEVTIIGFGDTIELWDPSEFNNEMETVEENAPDYLDYIAEKEGK